MRRYPGGGAFALFFHPIPTPGNLPPKTKKKANARGLARGWGGGMGAAGIGWCIIRTFVNNTFLKQFVSNGFALSSCCSFNFTVHVRYLVSVECVDYDTDVEWVSLITCLAKEDMRIV